MVLAVWGSCSLSLLLLLCCRPPAQAEVGQVEAPQGQPPQAEMQQAVSATSIPATPSSQYSAARLEQLMLNEELAFRGEHSLSKRCCHGLQAAKNQLRRHATVQARAALSGMSRQLHLLMRGCARALKIDTGTSI